jgi:hypothetical protein
LEDLKWNIGGNQRPRRESPSLSHEKWVWQGIEPKTSEVTGAEINFEHRSCHSDSSIWRILWKPQICGKIQLSFAIMDSTLAIMMQFLVWLSWQLSSSL